ncbi:MAG: hypothetical protein ABJA87_07290 [bacterium]
MWMFLSRRARRWALLSVAVPVARLALHQAAGIARRRAPGARSTRLLGQANSALSGVGRRR